jgi:hypothetical protein
MRRVIRRKKAGAIVKAAELPIAAPQVIALRTARTLAAGAYPDSLDRREVMRMSTEKLQAVSESMNAMAVQVYKANQELMLLAVRNWWTAWMNPWSLLTYPGIPPWILPFWPLPGFGSGATPSRSQRSMAKVIEKGLTPVHKRTTGNARRLGRMKKG